MPDILRDGDSDPVRVREMEDAVSVELAVVEAVGALALRTSAAHAGRIALAAMRATLEAETTRKDRA